MESFGLYLLKSVTWIAGFALVFILFLRNERFFFLNRIYLLAGILTSFLFPLISIHYTVILPVVQTVPADNAVVNEIQYTGKSVLPDLKIILLALYASGVLFVIALMFRQGKSVLRTIKKSEIISLRPVKLIKTSDYTSAFSFFSYVFVNPSITDVETKEIMIHEMVHIRQKHWVDLLLVELLCMMQWFNPLVWIYVRFIRQNHEYLADEVALQQTSDPAIYKAVLLNQIVGAPVVSLSNSFNYSPNKKRFAMMKNIITSPYRKMKVLLILPVFALVLFSFARPDYKYKYLNDGSSKFASTTSEQKAVKGKVVSEDNKPLPGATVVVRGTFNGASADINGYFKIDNVPADGNLVVSFVGFKSKVLKPDFNSDMTIKMVRDTVKLSRLEEVAPPPPPPPVPPVDNIKEIKDVPPPPSLNDAPPPLYVVDGTIVTKAEAEKISPETIASVNVLKDKKEIKPATEKYGEKGENGVVEITTKADMDKMLVVIDGVVKENVKLSEINSVTIASMNVLNRQGAIDKYGEKGKNGVAELITKSNDSSLTNQSSKPFVVVEELPQFQGGTDAMLTWIAANIKYPVEAIQGKIEGKVYVNFTVSTSGKVKDAVVIKSVSPTLNEEAIRVISSMPDWKPGKQAGKPVAVQYRVPVEFKLK
jgi:TonB family protein